MFKPILVPFNEWITGERLWRALAEIEQDDFVYLKTDRLTMRVIENKRVIVTHRSDYPINAKRFKLAPNTLKVWYAQNATFDNDKLKGLPLGCNNTVTPVCGNILKIYKKWEEDRKYRNLAYMNFGITNPIRHQVWNMFKDKPWVTCGKFDRTEKGHNDYIDGIYNHKVVISPPGNGVDCVRHWDSMYLGTMPIVEWSHAMAHFQGLPMAGVNKWEEVTKEFLTSCCEYDLFETGCEMLHLSHWVERIKADARLK